MVWGCVLKKMQVEEEEEEEVEEEETKEKGKGWGLTRHTRDYWWPSPLKTLSIISCPFSFNHTNHLSHHHDAWLNHVCFCVCVCVCVWLTMFPYVCMYVCMYLCMYVCMYVCMYIYTCIHTTLCVCVYVNSPLLYKSLSCNY